MRTRLSAAIAASATLTAGRTTRNGLARSLVFGLAMTMFAGLASASDASDWDLDSDGYLNNDEFYDGAAGLGTFSDYDGDSNGLLDDNEFGETDYDASFGYWDKDENGWLDTGEFYDGQYDYYDNNEDGQWDGNEWDDAGEDGFFDM